MNRSLAVNRARIIAVVCFLMVLSFVVVSVFWYYEYQYSLPTPIPINYSEVSNGTVISLPIITGLAQDKPVLLHFFNPDCPCSKFNIKHFKTLVKQYGDQVNFAVVLMTNKHYDIQQIKEELGLNIPVLTDKYLATQCGVYATPQAALIGKDKRLYFRGNYNQSRYCSDKRTEYARLAIKNLLYSKLAIPINPLAKRAYGCRLPDCMDQ